MLRFHRQALAIGALLIAVPAAAQTATPAAPAPAAPAPAAQATVTDAEVTGFAQAAVGVDKVRADTSIAEADKEAAILAKVQAAGLTPTRFNEIAQAAQTDTALQARLKPAVTAARASAQ